MAIKSKATQGFVPIEEVRDGVVILKDGSMRMILMVSSSNFALKSEDEQRAVLAQFQTFLNSLEFSTQIFIQSRRLDIRPYLSLLRERLKEQMGDLMRIQIQEYIDFIKNFTDSTNIMTKTFFVILPYSHPILSQKTTSPFDFFSKKKNATRKESREEQKLEAFEEARSQLEQRVSVAKQGLARTGLRAVVLGTEEIIELYYKFFNPGETEKPVKIKG
ncbi:MAG: hypothetical protein BMS9Abin13_583 [Patescibacteria group bacterium]|nr:MAG: hypothetical protein BMS9Abin13_583 [Patescibacteria group bacterium]